MTDTATSQAVSVVPQLGGVPLGQVAALPPVALQPAVQRVLPAAPPLPPSTSFSSSV